MAKLRVFYDFHDEGIKPFTMVIRFKSGEVQWEKPAFYIPLSAPFQRHMSDEYNDITGYTVLLEDLIVNFEKPNTFGVSLPLIKKRCGIEDITNDEPVHFMIRICDIEEVMQMDIRDFYDWGKP